MNIAQIIDEITTNECCRCKFGKCLIALKELRDGDGNVASPSVTESNAAPKRKLQRKTAVPKGKGSKECGACHNLLPIDCFPNAVGCKDGHAGTCKVCKVKQAKDRRNGASLPADRKDHGIEPEPQAGIIRCKLCDYRAIDATRLASHMRTSHGSQGL